MVVANIGMPQNARSLLVSPNVAPNTGFLRVAFTDAEERKLSQAEIAVKVREILNREFPGVEVLQYPGGLVASVFANGYTAPFVVEVHNENLAELDEEARAVAEVARTIPGVRDVRESLQTDYPEIHVDTDREEAGFVGSTERDGGPDDARRDPRQHQHARRLDRREQRPVVLRGHVLRRRAECPTPGPSARCPSGSSPEGKPVLLGAYGNVRRDARRRRGRAQPPRARRARAHADRGARPRLGRGGARGSAEEATRARANIDYRFVGQVGADARHLRRARPRAGPRGDGRLHDHGVAVQVAAPAVRHALHHPGVARPGSCSR